MKHRMSGIVKIEARNARSKIKSNSQEWSRMKYKSRERLEIKGKKLNRVMAGKFDLSRMKYKMMGIVENKV